MRESEYTASDLEHISRLTKRQAIAFIEQYGKARYKNTNAHRYIPVNDFHALYSMGYVDEFIKNWKGNDYDNYRVHRRRPENEQHK